MPNIKRKLFSNGANDQEINAKFQKFLETRETKLKEEIFRNFSIVKKQLPSTTQEEIEQLSQETNMKIVEEQEQLSFIKRNERHSELTK